MFTISSLAATIVVVMIILVAGCYFVVMNPMSKQIVELRGYAEGYFSLVDDLILGFKELKISATRRKNIMDKYLGPNWLFRSPKRTEVSTNRDNSENVDFRAN